jgi:hypothetical protein
MVYKETIGVADSCGIKNNAMKNPFEKERHTGLIAGLVIGGVVVAGLAYLFFTEDGEELLKSIGAGILSDKTGLKKRTVKKAADIAL